MKFRTVTKLSALAVVLSLSVVGCKKGLEKTTPLPGRGIGAVSPEQPGGPLGGDNTGGLKLPENPNPTPVSTPAVIDPNKTTPLNGNLAMWGDAAEQPFKAE